MPTHRDKQTGHSVLDQLQPHMSQGVERALEELDLVEESTILRFWGFELQRTRRVARSRRRRWGRWVSLSAILATLAAGVIKYWLIS